MPSLSRRYFHLILILCLHFQFFVVHAAPSVNEKLISITSVREKISVIHAKTNIEDELKKRILGAYTSAAANLEEQLKHAQLLEESKLLQKGLPLKIQQLQKKIKEIENRLAKPELEQISLFPIDELEHRLVVKKTKLNEIKSSLSQLDNQISELLKRPQQIREQIAELGNLKIDVQQKLSVLHSLVKEPLELDAQQSLLDSRLKNLSTTLTKLNQENIGYPLLLQSLRLQQQLLNLQSEQLIYNIEKLDDFITKQQQKKNDSAQAILLQAQKAATGKHPLIQVVTGENIRYNQMLQAIHRKINKHRDEKQKIEANYKQLEEDFTNAERKIQLAGLSPTLGNLLREQHRKLPTANTFKDKFDDLQEQIANASFELFQLEETVKSFFDVNNVLLVRMGDYPKDNYSESEWLEIRTEIRLLLIDQKNLVTELIPIYSKYYRLLADKDFSMHQLVNLGEKFNIYLDQRLLWVPSAPVMNKKYLQDSLQSILWILNPAFWKQFAFDLSDSVASSPTLTILGIILISIQLWFRTTIKQHLQDLYKKTIKIYTDKFIFTFYGLGYISLLVMPFTMLAAWVGWLLQNNHQSAHFSLLIANGFMSAAVPLFILQFLYQLFKPEGYAHSLFGWQEHTVRLLFSKIRFIQVVAVPASFLIGMFIDDPYSIHSYSIGRMALIIAMFTLSYVLFSFAHPEHGLGKNFYQSHPNSWFNRLRYIWPALLPLFPIVIIGFAIAGYYQSALELFHKLVILLRLAFLTAIMHEIVIRGMVLATRKLALQNARQKRKLKEQAESTEKTTDLSVNPEEESLLDIPKINEQSRKLLNVATFAILIIGTWLTLKDILPALSIFDKWTLWQHVEQVEGQDVLQPITLVNLLFCVVNLLLMLVFVKNFPGLIDLLFVGNYSLSAGSRYALIQLSRYAVVTLTFIASANELGGSWSQVQWLVAAMSVGLGFGLQEIFANMVSGIILLFERPIRVGDTVSIGDISGTVSQIKMRATTIVDWNKKEIIVPNKTFITDKLVNWTLTDAITRVVIPVGIAYKSDEEQALEIFKQVITESPFVLETPEPSVFFLALGESSLDFEIRVFVRSLVDRFEVTDDILRRIRRAFKQNNIEIPFPQRDLHIRSGEILPDKSSC